MKKNVLTDAVWPLPRWFVPMLVINAVIVLVYWLLCRLRDKEAAGGYRMRCAVMLLFPAAGPLFLGLSWVIYRLLLHEPVDLDDVIFSKDKSETVIKADEEKERDLVPLEEAIAITDQQSTRALMMDVVRRDISHSLATLSRALNSEDSEVSHYAAAVLQDALDRLRVSFQKLYRAILELEDEVAACDGEDAPLRLYTADGGPDEETHTWKDELSNSVAEAERENAEAVTFHREEERRIRSKEEAYRQALLARDGVADPAQEDVMEKLAREVEEAHTLLDDLYQTLRQNVLSVQEKLSYVDMMQKTAELIDRRERPAAYELEALAEVLLDVGRYEDCRVWCQRSVELYPLALSSFSTRLRLYYTISDRESFFRVLDELKAADVVLDHETLELVRVFL